MLKRLLTISIVVLSFMTIFSFNVQAQDDTEYLYAYFTYDPNFEFKLNLVDPDDAQQATSLVIPAEQGQRIIRANPSPDGVWIAATMMDMQSSRPDGTYTLRLFSPISGEIRDSFSISSFLQVVWSPDSEWLAIIAAGAEADSSLALYVYNIESDSRTYLGGGGDEPYLYYNTTWSADGTRLLAVGEYCLSQFRCGNTFKVFEVPSFTVLHSIDFDSDSRVCEFTWSPDNQSIAFLYACGDAIGDGLWEYFRDIYRLDLSTGEFTQLTYFAQQAENFTTLISYKLVYSFSWYDRNTLLIAMYGGPYQGGIGYDDVFFIQETAAYYADGTQTFLADQPLRDWTLNPIYPTEITYRREEYVLFTDEYNMRRDELISANIEIATFDGTSLNVVYSSGEGYDFHWSPDGMTLAYTILEEPSANGWREMDGLRFVSRETWSETTFTIPEEARNSMGWLLMPED